MTTTVKQETLAHDCHDQEKTQSLQRGNIEKETEGMQDKELFTQKPIDPQILQAGIICPYCNTENSAEQVQCACGYYFNQGANTKAIQCDTKETDQKSQAEGDMVWGALWCIGGIVVTLVTYSKASPGGTYIVAWGAILFGAIQFFKGLVKM